MVGMTTEKEVTGLIQELEKFGVFSRSEGGLIYSRRMVKDNLARHKGKINGSAGGNPILVGKPPKVVNPPDNPPDNPLEHNSDTEPVKTEKRDEKGEKKDSELRSAPKTAQDALWADGLPILADLLKKPVDATLRGFLGKLVRESGGKPQEVMRALWDAQKVNPLEPAAWLMKAVIPKSRQLSPAELLAEEQSKPSPTNPRGYKVSPLIGT
jgi:hypothetical protein